MPVPKLRVDTKFQQKIKELKKKMKNMSAEEIAALSDVEKAALIGETKKEWKREALFNRIIGYYTLWCFIIGTVTIVFLAWKLIKFIYNVIF